MNAAGSDHLTVYRARWIVPVDAPPLREGAIAIRQERIVHVGKQLASSNDAIDLGEAIVLPGLVNAHTHLEFSDCAAPLTGSVKTFASWISEVTGYRAQRAAANPGAAPRAIKQGLEESTAAGTTTIGDIATTGWRLPDHRIPIDVIAFWELIALAEDRFRDVLDHARAHVDRSLSEGRLAGVSPHAPYTVHPDLFDRAIKLAVERGLPVAFHLAESLEELELLRSNSGPLVDYLCERGFWLPTAIPRGTRPLDYLRRLAQAPRSLIVHGNYLDAEEIDFLARQANMSVVYCPRTHGYFGHDRHPLEQLLNAGARVALGTDSRASNPDLSLLAEIRCAARRFPMLPAERVFRLGTLDGAAALGLEREVGSLRPGKLANLAVIATDHRCANPLEVVFESELPVTATMCRGRWVHPAGPS
jgi:cytosine/adenosine deaminase-related metal-dependent hydrolase